MTRLVFVRHAEPVVTEGVPAAEWSLTDRGREGAAALGAKLARSAESSTDITVWTSPERRAHQTAEIAVPSVAALVREQLREVRKAWHPTTDDLARAVARYLRGEVVEGWERREEVVARLAQLKADFRPGERLVVVSHGVLLTTWLDQEIGLDDPFSFWADLRMPDAWELDPEEKSFRRIA